MENTILNTKFEEATPLNSVAEFHHTFGAPILDKPQIPSKERCDLRVSLLQEELDELKEAIQNNDIVEIADALADLQVILSGSILEFGVASKFKQIFDDVHRSNMSKACSTIEEAERTIKWYKSDKGVDSYWLEKDGKYIVYRKGDDKVLKSVDYTPADPKSIIEN